MVTYCVSSFGSQPGGVPGDQPVLLVQPAGAVQDAAGKSHNTPSVPAASRCCSYRGATEKRVRYCKETAMGSRRVALEIIWIIPFFILLPTALKTLCLRSTFPRIDKLWL